jgi:hypothetical protein
MPVERHAAKSVEHRKVVWDVVHDLNLKKCALLHLDRGLGRGAAVDEDHAPLEAVGRCQAGGEHEAQRRAGKGGRGRAGAGGRAGECQR